MFQDKLHIMYGDVEHISITSKRWYDTPDWFRFSEVAKMFEHHPDLQALMPVHEHRIQEFFMRFGRAAGSLAITERSGKVPQRDLDVFEFGSGVGVGLIVLDMLAKSGDRQLAQVTGSEVDESRHVQSTMVASVLDTVGDISNDGIATMLANPGRFDVIFAHRFGPCRNAFADDPQLELPEQFIHAALGALKEDGVIAVDSDSVTMEYVLSRAQEIPELQMQVINPNTLPVGYASHPHILLTH